MRRHPIIVVTVVVLVIAGAAGIVLGLSNDEPTESASPGPPAPFSSFCAGCGPGRYMPEIGQLDLRGGYVEFPEQPVGTTSAPKTATVTATGDFRGRVYLRITVSGGKGPQFDVVRHDCDSLDEQHPTCTLDVVFHPTAPGTQTDQVTIFGFEYTDWDPGRPTPTRSTSVSFLGRGV